MNLEKIREDKMKQILDWLGSNKTLLFNLLALLVLLGQGTGVVDSLGVILAIANYFGFGEFVADPVVAGFAAAALAFVNASVLFYGKLRAWLPQGE
jgi:hypothetical protein